MKREKPPSQTWESKCEALENAFRRLQIWRGESAAPEIPYELLIGDIPRQLMLMVPTQRPKTSGICGFVDARGRLQLMEMGPNPLPELLPPKKALQLLARSTGRTIQVLDALPEAALHALNYRREPLRQLQTTLRMLHLAAKDADIKTRRSRPPTNPRVKEIAQVVAQHYFGLTGKKPTVSVRHRKPTMSVRRKVDEAAPFVELLTTVFKILGIKNSAASQAKMVTDSWPSIVANLVVKKSGT